jgi:hypothetical protein
MRRLCGLATVMGGCLVPNPSYVDGTGAAGSTTDASASGTTATGTTDGAGTIGGTGTGGESTTEEVTGAVVTTGVDATGGSTGVDTSGTTGVQPGSADIPADIATCALLPTAALAYQGPDECEVQVTIELMQDSALRDGLIVDLQFDNAQGRPAWGFVRFDPTATVPPGAMLTAATLVLTVSPSPAQNFAIASSGQVKPASAFDLTTLAAGAPIVAVDGVSIGLTNPGEIKMIDVTALVASQWPSAIHLAIEPQDYTGRVYMNHKSDAPPRLIVDWQ